MKFPSRSSIMPKIQKKETERTLLPHEIRLENGDIRPMTEAEIIQKQIQTNTGQVIICRNLKFFSRTIGIYDTLKFDLDFSVN